MKKIYMMLAVAAISTAAFAQRNAVNTHANLSRNALSTNNLSTLPPYDTIGGASWSNPNAQPTIYRAVDSNQNPYGYLCGNNGYGDKQKAQSFIVSNPMNVIGAIYWFGAKFYGSANTNSGITYKLYNMNGTGTNASSTSAAAPGTVIASQNIGVSVLDTALSLTFGTNVWMLTNPAYVTTDFAIGFDMANLNTADSVALVTSTDGDAGGTDEAWEQWSDNSWHSFLEANNWGIDVDLFILAIVDQNTGVNEYVNGIKMYQNSPNPFYNSTSINYELEKNADDVKLTVLDLTGRTVKVITEGKMEAGKHVIKLDANDFAPGQYIFSLSANGNNLTKKMTVVH